MPILKSVPSELPDPPYPADTMANGYRPEFDIRRIKQSSTWKLADGKVRNILLRLWFEAWEEIPVGSFDSDDELIAASIDVDLGFFQGYRKQIMRGWKLHSDNRLYHPYITEQVLKMLKKRKKSTDKVREWRKKKALEDSNCNRLQTSNQPVGNQAEQEQEQEYSSSTSLGNLESPSSFLSRENEKPSGEVRKNGKNKSVARIVKRATSHAPWEDVSIVIDRVNQRSGRRHRLKNAKGEYTADAHLIRDRISESSLDDAMYVVDNQADLWVGDEKMEKYFRTGTLFAKGKFEQYRSTPKKPAYVYGSFLDDKQSKIIEGEAVRI